VNVHFVVYRLADGEVEKSGTCAKTVVEKQAGTGQAVLIVKEPIVGNQYAVRDGQLVRRTVAPVMLSYQQQRRQEYPPLSDFADAMYWQLQGDASKMEAYLAKVAAVKARYPKPSNN
jgi:hypothetical protein